MSNEEYIDLLQWAENEIKLLTRASIRRFPKQPPSQHIGALLTSMLTISFIAAPDEDEVHLLIVNAKTDAKLISDRFKESDSGKEFLKEAEAIRDELMKKHKEENK